LGHGSHDHRTLRPCDPVAHQVPIRFVSAEPSRLQVALTSVEQPFLLIVIERPEPHPPYFEVRAHGPPARSHIPPRAPPVIAFNPIT
jgi:hypothetical protein